MEGDTIKRKDLIALLERNGFYLKRNGGNHDLYANESQVTIPIPRHTEINELLAKSIIKKLNLK